MHSVSVWHFATAVNYSTRVAAFGLVDGGVGVTLGAAGPPVTRLALVGAVGTVCVGAVDAAVNARGDVIGVLSLPCRPVPAEVAWLSSAFQTSVNVHVGPEGSLVVDVNVSFIVKQLVTVHFCTARCHGGQAVNVVLNCLQVGEFAVAGCWVIKHG